MLKRLLVSFLLLAFPAFSQDYQQELLRAILNKRFDDSTEIAMRINKLGLDLSKAHPISGETPLTMAVKKEWHRGVRLLLILGANPYIPNLDRLTPLMLAQNSGNADIMAEFRPPLPLQES